MFNSAMRSDNRPASGSEEDWSCGKDASGCIGLRCLRYVTAEAFGPLDEMAFRKGRVEA